MVSSRHILEWSPGESRFITTTIIIIISSYHHHESVLWNWCVGVEGVHTAFDYCSIAQFCNLQPERKREVMMTGSAVTSQPVWVNWDQQACQPLSHINQ